MTDRRVVAEFELNQLVPVAMMLVVAGVSLAFGLSVMGSTRDEFGDSSCNTGYSYNDSGDICFNVSSTTAGSGLFQAPVSAYYNGSVNALDSVVKVANKLPTIGLVVVASVILGIVVRFMYMQN